MLQNTPILSHIVKDTSDSISEIIDIIRSNKNTEEANYQALKVLLGTNVSQIYYIIFICTYCFSLYLLLKKSASHF